jgi:hypothetical protein
MDIWITGSRTSGFPDVGDRYGRKGVADFRELRVYQEALDLATDIYTRARDLGHSASAMRCLLNS